mmetsp:Transcript_18150/g.43758  ORF Transcript_18150/g.43758 Transcript_18150/m.43758 type:complete len:125 (+) Transcript_18150:807-1181(+)
MRMIPFYTASSRSGKQVSDSQCVCFLAAEKRVALKMLYCQPPHHTETKLIPASQSCLRLQKEGRGERESGNGSVYLVLPAISPAAAYFQCSPSTSSMLILSHPSSRTWYTDTRPPDMASRKVAW